MNDAQKNEQVNPAVIVLGALVAVAAISLAGKSVYSYYNRPDQRARDVKDIISQCHATINEMDMALKRLQPSEA